MTTGRRILAPYLWQQNGFAPSNPAESATLQTNLAPGAYTVVVTGKNVTQGISLAEVYDLSARDPTLSWGT